MAKLVMAAATPHNPLLWRAMVEPMPDDLVGVAANFARIRDTITELGVDVAIVVGTDHIRQFFFDNSPAFIIGKAERYHGTYENEVRTFGMEYVELAGHRELADEIAGREVLPEAIDFSVSHEWRLDHGFVIPLQYLTPALDIPIVPIHVNAALPPLPSPRRFAALGEHLREAVERWDSDARVAILTSGHMATDVGGPEAVRGLARPGLRHRGGRLDARRRSRGRDPRMPLRPHHGGRERDLPVRQRHHGARRDGRTPRRPRRGDRVALRLEPVLPLEGRLMSRYMIDKFMRAVEMSDAAVAEYVADPAAFVDAWLSGTGSPDLPTDDRALTEAERAAFAARDFEALYVLGAHPYLLWHFTEAVFTHEFTPDSGWRDLVERYRAAVAPHGVVDYIA